MTHVVAFEGSRLIHEGPLAEVAVKAKKVLERGERGPVLIFDAVTSRLVEVDFRGTAADVVARLQPDESAPRGPGRPKLGVVAREVTLLPRHWDWLAGQPGGASVALRRLVEEARKANAEKDRAREAEESAYRFLSAMAGNLAGFEEATRALFAGDGAKFAGESERWPAGVRDHARRLFANITASQ